VSDLVDAVCFQIQRKGKERHGKRKVKEREKEEKVW
jgi:hypothetical protein